VAKSTKKRTPAVPRKTTKSTKAMKATKPTKALKRVVRKIAAPTASVESGASVLDRLFEVVASRRTADPAISHSARLLSRGTAKVAQKFGEEAVECLIEAIAGNRDALVAESADVLYHLIVLWVNAEVQPSDVWGELARREGVSGVVEKASRPKALQFPRWLGTTKIP
jgi:phosphoribosyl-ATP pyrophosphohydrolase